MAKKRTIESYLPLTPAVFHVLLALADGEKHGYVISKEIARRTGNEVRLSAGTLYGVIKRLLDDNLIEESEDRPDFSLDDQRRRYYRLTKLGKRRGRSRSRAHGTSVGHGSRQACPGAAERVRRGEDAGSP